MMKGMLSLRDYGPLNLVLSVLALKRHAYLWLIWTSVLSYLSLFLQLLVKLLVFCGAPPSLVPPGFLRSWWGVSVPPLTVRVLVLLCKGGLVDFYLWKALKKRNWTMRWSSLTEKIMIKKKIWEKRYVYSIIFISLMINNEVILAYKYYAEQLKIYTSNFTYTTSIFLTAHHTPALISWINPSAMAPSAPPGKVKDKGKTPLVAESGFDSLSKNSINLPNEKLIPTLKSPSGGSSSKIKIKKGNGATNKLDLTDMFNKLTASRENGKKKKELTLVGFLVGERKEFPMIFAKLRMEWKPLNGTLTFNVLKSGWFEVSFSNQDDFHLIWANRPYHLFSQLLLIKQWYPGFNPTNESISQMDLWVRLHYLPEEFANSEALVTIIEGNGIGKFLKMDPSHNSERWNLFTRFCINTDVEKSVGKGVIVPDEHLNQIKFSLWFDDFSPGCGACGKTAHTFRECPNKNAPTLTIQLTLRKPSSKQPQAASHPSPSLGNQGWNLMGKNNKVVNPSKLIIPNNNIYLTERGGICITYESDDSDEGLQHLLNNEEVIMDEPNVIAIADLHPYNIIMKEKEALKSGVGKQVMEEIDNDHPGDHQKYLKNNEKEALKMTSTAQIIKCQDQHIFGDDSSTIANAIGITNNCNHEEKMESRDRNIQEVLSIGNPTKGLLADGASSLMPHKPTSLDPLEPLPKDIADLKKDGKQLHPMEEELQDYDEEPFDYEYDDLLVDEPGDNNNPNNYYEEGQSIMISNDPPFSEKDLDDFINNEMADNLEAPVLSEGTFHSMNNSFNASTSFVNGMERLIVHQPVRSNSTSSKRKMSEGIEDTATSDAREGKRSRN